MSECNGFERRPGFTLISLDALTLLSPSWSDGDSRDCRGRQKTVISWRIRLNVFVNVTREWRRNYTFTARVITSSCASMTNELQIHHQPQLPVNTDSFFEALVLEVSTLYRRQPWPQLMTIKNCHNLTLLKRAAHKTETSTYIRVETAQVKRNIKVLGLVLNFHVRIKVRRTRMKNSCANVSSKARGRKMAVART